MIECGQLWAERKRLLNIIRADPQGVSLADVNNIVNNAETGGVLREMWKIGEVKMFHGAAGRTEYVMPDDPWYHEPKQQFMRRAVLQLLHARPAGYSRRALTIRLRRRDKECDETYVRRLMARMLNEGVVIVTTGTETVMERLVDLDGRTHKPQGAATMTESAVEKQATVFRLSAGKWLKDNSK